MESMEMDERQYCLKWNNHPKNISSVFDRLRMEELFVDVTLATQDKQVIRAHRVILCAGSGYLEQILSSTDAEHPTVVLCNIDFNDLKLLVDFMYTGEISVDQQQFPTLLDAAKSLQIRGLYEEEAKSVSEERENKDEKLECEEKIGSELSISRNVSDEAKMTETSFKSPETRKRSHSEESEEEPIDSPHSIKHEDDLSHDETPSSKMFKSMYGPFQGVSNPFWMMSQKAQENKSSLTTPHQQAEVVPNLMNFVSQANLLQQKNDSPQHKLNEQILAAMQNVICTNPYLNPISSMQKPVLLSQNYAPGYQPGLSTSKISSSPNSKTGLQTVRRYKQYSEDSLQAALKEIVNGQSINRSSMKHNIPARTLRDWMKRLNIKSVFTHHSHNKERQERSHSQEVDQESSGSSGSPDPRSSDMTSPVFEASTGPSLFSAPTFPGMKMKEEEEIDDEEPKPLRIDEKQMTQIAQKAN